MSWPRGAGRWLLICALGGMLGCRELPRVELSPADRLLDQAWLALQRGDEQALSEIAAAGARGVALDGALHERLARDLQWLREGRAVALVDALDAASPWAARYMASAEAARAWLDGHTPTDRGPWGLERARLAESLGRRIGLAREALSRGEQAAEALALWAEAELAAGDLAQVERLLSHAPDTARLAWVRRRLELACGQPLRAAAGLASDLERDRISPQGLALLGRLLLALPDAALEARVLQAVRARPHQGWAQALEGRRLTALLLARGGALDAAVELAPRVTLDDQRLANLWSRRLASAGPVVPEPPDADDPWAWASLGPEALSEADPKRADGADVAQLALMREWELAARAAYVAGERGAGPDLDGFLAALDRAAAGLPGSPTLADLPRRDFGLLGTLLDPTPLEELSPGTFLLGGQGLLQPPEITVYDVVGRTLRTEGEATWVEHLVVRQRVPGFVASRGGVFTGAGIVDRVFLDLELVGEELRRLQGLQARPWPAARPAADTAARRSLAEPLDVVQALRVAALADCAGDLAERVLEGLSLHEGQHILDAQEFLQRGVFGRLGMLLQGGLLPARVRAELERRAQLRALRLASEPRLVLADCIARLPVEGAARHSEHAVGFEALVQDLIEVLDRGAWEGARPLHELGLDRERNLLQQLHLLDVPTLRALALAVPD